jgi:hypothetical protein
MVIVADGVAARVATSSVCSSAHVIIPTLFCFEMAAKNSKDSIKRTGELLLSGWKLLNSACPVCNTALLSKGENLRCPMCDLPVVTEANQVDSGTLYILYGLLA